MHKNKINKNAFMHYRQERCFQIIFEQGCKEDTSAG